MSHSYKHEFCNFLGLARGSLLELESHLAIARDLRYLSDVGHLSLEKQCDEVRCMLNGLLESLKGASQDNPAVGPLLET